QSNFDRARVYRLRIQLYQLVWRHDDALTASFEALRLFGITFPESDDEIRVATEAAVTECRRSLRGQHVADLVDAPVVSDSEVRMIIGLLVESLVAAYNFRAQYFPL